MIKKISIVVLVIAWTWLWYTIGSVEQERFDAELVVSAKSQTSLCNATLYEMNGYEVYDMGDGRYLYVISPKEQK